MKSKAPLVLMEQVIMILVFALTAAMCLRMFVLADRLSVKYAARDRAVVEAQNAAERMKQGQWEYYLSGHQAVGESESVIVMFDQKWETTAHEEKAEYFLRIFPMECEQETLWKAEIVVYAGDEELFRLTVAGQKTEVKEDA